VAPPIVLHEKMTSDDGEALQPRKQMIILHYAGVCASLESLESSESSRPERVQ
jgi:hypothetical protein